MVVHARMLLAALAVSALAACAAQPAAAPAGNAPATAASSSILQRSTPAAGSTVAAPVDALILDFVSPARLNEVMVSGPDGQMPMMIDSAGEQTHYSVPLPGLGAGAYTVNWRATSAGQDHRGSFAFTVK